MTKTSLHRRAVGLVVLELACGALPACSTKEPSVAVGPGGASSSDGTGAGASGASGASGTGGHPQSPQTGGHGGETPAAGAASEDAGAAGSDASPEPTGPCAPSPCDAHALCSATSGSAVCTCLAGYLGDGTMCSVAPNPCVAAGTCPEGEWVQHQLPGMTADDTVQTVLNDPARPSDFYAFVGSNGGPTIKVYRSVDFGDTWENRNKTAEITGNPWGASIDPNPNRDPGTPPTLWSPSGYGAVGAWKSVDGGETWVRSTACDAAYATFNPFGAAVTDLYHIAILPDDPPNHVLATYHYYFKDRSDGGFGETWDGGKSWTIHPPPDGIGTSHYVIPISGTTWAVIAQDNSGQNGIWRTTTAGRIGGTEAAKFRDGTISTAAWTKVDDLEHAHGSHQNVVLADGTILVTGWVTGARSVDHGATWQHFTNGSWAEPHQFEQSSMTNLAVTDRFIYTTMMANTYLARAPLSDAVGAAQWTISYCTKPDAYHEGGGPFGMAAAYQASIGKWVIVAGTLHSGIWKYVEP